VFSYSYNLKINFQSYYYRSIIIPFDSHVILPLWAVCGCTIYAVENRSAEIQLLWLRSDLIVAIIYMSWI